ncbi:MAG: 3-phosphoshikimate 1-carboxyvinyltransferase [Acidobacteriota bacterium]
MTASSSNSDPYVVPAGRRVDGRVRVPSSKSITQRFFALALVGKSEVVVHRPLLSEDTRLFLGGLAACGFDIEHGSARVTVRPPTGEPPIEREVFCGAGGTMLRLLTACLAVVPGRSRLDGIARLRERPLGPLIAALEELGVRIRSLEEPGHAPLEIRGPSLRGGTCELDASRSSQFLSALLIAAQAAPRETHITVPSLTSEPYVDLTLDAIRAFGGEVEVTGPDEHGVRRYRVYPTNLGASEVWVEADYSAVAYPAAAALVTGGVARIEGVVPDSKQGDRHFLELLRQMGAEVTWGEDFVEVRAGAEGLRAIEADLSTMPDQVPTLAALAPFARGTTRIDNVAHLRIKESDRLRAMSTELRRLGAEVDERDDGLVIPGVWADAAPPSEPVVVDSWGDHRIAMSLALVGLRRPGVSVAEPRVVAKSYPAFWQDVETLIR